MPLDRNDHSITIPDNFKSHSTGTFFASCLECDRYLLDGKSEYFIEKAIKTYQGFTAEDVIFEYAICLTCAEKMRQKMSKESMQSIQNYFMNNMNVNERMQLMQANPNNPEEWLKECLIKGSDIKESEEFQIYAHCKGEHLITTQMPYMISGKALDEVSNLLSNKTLDALDDFMNKHLGPDPSLMEQLPFKRRVVLI